MPEPSMQTALRESVVEVLEKMFFISALEGECRRTASLRPCLAAQLEFEGDPPGRLTLEVTRPAARSIAADFLGEDPETLSMPQVEEVVCELANMICGAVLSKVESRALFRLGSPRILRDGMPAGQIQDGTLMVTVQVEGGECPVSERYAF